MLGDNLGSHRIGGFLENFSTVTHFCRYCYITKNSFHREPSKVFPLRNSNSYEDDVTMLSISGEPANGVKMDSILNNCNYFRVCNPGLPPCLAHDLLEGVLQYDFMLCLNKLIILKYLILDTINDKLQNLRFTHESKYDRIPLIKKGDKLVGGSASENLRLILIFPFAVQDIANEDFFYTDYWEMLKILREICCLVMVAQISIGQIALLKSLINEYIQLRIILFPDVKLRPKHHYLTHYPYLIRMFGPLKHMWTLRYESKHSYFKNILKRSPNFKNILHTLSERHQFLQALHATHATLFSDKIIADEAVTYSVDNYEPDVVNHISEFCTFRDIKLICTKAIFRGIQYTAGMHICCKKSEFDNFILCSIRYIVINSQYNDLYFFGAKIEIAYNKVLGLYEEEKESTDETNSFYGSHYKDLISHEPCMHFQGTEKSLFSFKSSPLEML